MVGFVESPRFPEGISYGSTGGPSYNTDVVPSKSGWDSVNENWSMPLHHYNAQNGIQSVEDAETILNFFHGVGGRGKGFRYKDWMDYKTCSTRVNPAFNNQNIGTGDAVNKVFYLSKAYVLGSVTRTRRIYKPVSGTVTIGVNGVLISSGAYTIDYTKGIVTFTTAPANGHTVTWGGEFDVPCRFASDDFDASINHYDDVNIQLALDEIRIK